MNDAACVQSKFTFPEILGALKLVDVSANAVYNHQPLRSSQVLTFLRKRLLTSATQLSRTPTLIGTTLSTFPMALPHWNGRPLPCWRRRIRCFFCHYVYSGSSCVDKGFVAVATDSGHASDKSLLQTQVPGHPKSRQPKPPTRYRRLHLADSG